MAYDSKSIGNTAVKVVSALAVAGGLCWWARTVTPVDMPRPQDEAEIMTACLERQYAMGRSSAQFVTTYATHKDTNTVGFFPNATFEYPAMIRSAIADSSAGVKWLLPPTNYMATGDFDGTFDPTNLHYLVTDATWWTNWVTLNVQHLTSTTKYAATNVVWTNGVPIGTTNWGWKTNVLYSTTNYAVTVSNYNAWTADGGKRFAFERDRKTLPWSTNAYNDLARPLALMQWQKEPLTWHPASIREAQSNFFWAGHLQMVWATDDDINWSLRTNCDWTSSGWTNLGYGQSLFMLTAPDGKSFGVPVQNGFASLGAQAFQMNFGDVWVVAVVGANYTTVANATPFTWSQVKHASVSTCYTQDLSGTFWLKYYPEGSYSVTSQAVDYVFWSPLEASTTKIESLSDIAPGGSVQIVSPMIINSSITSALAANAADLYSQIKAIYEVHALGWFNTSFGLLTTSGPYDSADLDILTHRVQFASLTNYIHHAPAR